MRYRVELSPDAERELKSTQLYLRERAPHYAPAWVAEMRHAVLSLREMPQRCALAPESNLFEAEIRQLLQGSHRILFTIAGRTVRVLHIRHASQRPLDPSSEE